MIRVAIVEDESDYARLLKRLFSSTEGYSCVGVFHRPVTFLGEIQRLEVDVVLLDINLPKISGLDCIRNLKELKPDVRVLMLTVHDDEASVVQAFAEGADGYLLKDASPAKMFAAIEEAMTGGAPMSCAIARKVVELLGKQSRENAGGRENPTTVRKLTEREAEVLRLLAAGHQYGEAAAELGVSLATVKTHIHHIYEKLEVRNKAEAVAKFLG